MISKKDSPSRLACFAQELADRVKLAADFKASVAAADGFNKISLLPRPD